LSAGAHLRLIVDGVDVFDVEYSSDFDQGDEARTGALSNLFREAIPHLIFKVLFLNEPEAYLSRVLGEEEALIPPLEVCDSRWGFPDAGEM
jgi:hypothetical protein